MDGVGMKRESLDIRVNIKAFWLVEMTGFEPATTRPPELKFIFIDRFNYL